MKKTISLFLIITLLAGIFNLVPAVTAEENVTGAADEILWGFELEENGAVLTEYLGSSTDVYIPSTVKQDGEEYSVVKIGDGIFKDNKSLNSATLGAGITEIGESAFEGASSLVCVVTNSELSLIGANAFKDCSAFNSIILYEAVTSIGENAFDGCSDLLVIYGYSGSCAESYASENGIAFTAIGSVETPLTYTENGVTYFLNDGEAVASSFDGSVTEVVIPASVQGLPVTGIRTVFRENDTLKSITLPNSIKQIDAMAFYHCDLLTNVNLPEGLESIGSQSFSCCQNLSRLKLPEGLKSIGYGAFQYSENLYDITLPDSLETLGNSAFAYVTCLEKMVIPKKLTAVPDYAFSYTGLRSLTLHENVTIIGNAAFRQCELQELVIPDGVTTISPYAFDNCVWLKTVSVADTVTSMSNSVFSGCTSLETVKLSDNLTYISSSVFYKCTKLKSVTMPSKLKSINNDAFAYCSSLDSINIPETVTYIGDSAFSGCTNIQKVTVPQSVSTIYANSFPASTILMVYDGSAAYTFAKNNILLYYVITGDEEPEVYTVDGIRYMIENSGAVAVVCVTNYENVVIPETVNGYPVTDIRTVFRENTTLKTIVIPGTVKALESYAFYKCTNLTKVELSEGMTSIGLNAFFGCSKLTDITIPETVTSLGSNVFYWCKALSSITIPESITELPQNAFYECTALKEVNLPSTMEIIGQSAFYGCKALAEIEIPYGVKELKFYVFENCTALKEITIPDSVTYVGAYLFRGCTALEKAVLPDTLKSVPAYLFYNCKSLKSFEISDKITQINIYAFYGCTSLSEIDIPESVTTVGSKAFAVCSKLMCVTLSDKISSLAADSFSENTVWFVYENSYAHSFAEDNGIQYYLITDTNTPEIYEENGLYYCISDGEAAVVCSDKTLTEAVIPSEIKGVSVTSIRSGFKGNTKLKSITLPESITQIGVSSFEGCTALADVQIGGSVTEIGKNAFKGCTALTELNNFSDVRVIGEYAFYGCTNLNIELPEALESIGERAFASCKAISKLNFSDKITTIPQYAFLGCTGIKSVEIPANIESLGEGAFNSCTGITEVTLAEGVKTIGTKAFNGCSSLKSIVIPDSVTVMGSYVFQSCTVLEDVTLSANLKAIYAYTFSSCKALKQIYIPESVTGIYDFAFYYCTALETVIMNEGVAQIGKYAFGNTALKILKIPESTETFGTAIAPNNTILIVYKDSAAKTYADENNFLNFVIQKTENPEIAYGAGISGTVTYTDGTAVSNVKVEILYDDGTVKQFDTTDENGAYDFTYAEVGRYTLRATDLDGNTTEEFISVKRMNVFEVFVTGTADLVLKPESSWSISGTVEPAGEAEVSLCSADGNVLLSVSVADGSYMFTNVSNGTYILKAETEVGTAFKEVTVFNDNKTDIVLRIGEISATVTGYVEVEDRAFNKSRRSWVDVTLYNEEGIRIGTHKTDKDGRYTFNNLPAGEYSIAAETSEMRVDKHRNYSRPHKLTGYGYVNVTASGVYEAETIVLCEENENKAVISGKVTAQGENQACEVTLRNVFRHEIDCIKTGNNGKYTFSNVRDGLYFITAVTESDGMGFTVIVVRNGKIYGNTDITVYKSTQFKNREDKWKNEVPHCEDRNAALAYRDRIKAEKEYFDGLSEKEKQQFSKEYINRLHKLAEWIADFKYSSNDENIKIENGGSVISGDEIENECEVEFILNVEKTVPHEKSENGINSKDDYIQHSIEDTAGDSELAQYYNITLTKTVDQKEYIIENIARDTDTTGKLRITIPIPDEYKGHKKYSFVHVHNGETTVLADLDDDPDTVTFEIDRFSTFALAFSDEDAEGEDSNEIITYMDGEITVNSSENASLYIAEYDESGSLTGLIINSVYAGVADSFTFSQSQAAFLWSENMEPLCSKFTITNEGD